MNQSRDIIQPEDYQRIREVFEAALSYPAADRAGFIERACGGSAALISEVQRMLAADSEAHSLLDGRPLTGHGLREGDRFANHFEIGGTLGRGGMGEVYLGRDTKLNREVAIKVLPSTFTSDPDRLARFRREAQVLASLNHPNIGAIYSFEESDGIHALTLEYIKGPTLADRIAHGPIPLETALSIARQIAEALEAAHEQGIVHRDLKPSNIKLRSDEVVKVLDFGLAKAAEQPATAGHPADSPTLTISATRAGIILGTASYMSPEQAAGKPVDKRSDIWSFGVALWEMLTGKLLFEGETISHTIADVLRAEIDFDKLPATTPSAIRDLLRRCLDRNVKSRLRDIGEARIVIQKYFTNPPIAPEVAAHRGPPARLATASSVAAVALLAAFSMLAFVHFREQKIGRDLVRFEFPVPEKVTYAQNLAVSPNGKRVTFAAMGTDGVSRLWIHSFESLDSSPLVGTEGVSLNGYPFWSWDSRFVVFGTGAFGFPGKLKRVEVSGGPPQTICDVAELVMGGFWSRKGQIVFGTAITGLLQVPATGGSPSPLTARDPAHQERNHGFPVLLPDERHFLYRIFTNGKPEYAGVYVGLLDAAPTANRGRKLLPDEAEIVFARSLEPGASGDDGHVLFVRASTLMAQPFDAARSELSGEPVPIAQPVAPLGQFGVSANGVLVYQAGASQDRQLTWFDRRGNVLATAAPPAPYNFLALSPDDTRAAVQRLESFRTGDIWILDLTRGGVGTRFTFHPADDAGPVWSPDGKRIVWATNRNGQHDLYQRSIAGGGEEPLLQSPLVKIPFDWSSDGRYLMYGVRNSRSNSDLWVLPMTSERQPWAFANTEFNERQGQFSPDMRWVAYQSDESGGNEIHVKPFSPGSGGAANIMVSSGGGYQPRWRRKDGKELYYFTGDGKLAAVDVAGGDTLKLGQPHVLFAPPIWAGGPANEVRRWDVTADGQKFLIPTVPASAKKAFTVVMNWQAAMKK